MFFYYLCKFELTFIFKEVFLEINNGETQWVQMIMIRISF